VGELVTAGAKVDGCNIGAPDPVGIVMDSGLGSGGLGLVGSVGSSVAVSLAGSDVVAAAVVEGNVSEGWMSVVVVGGSVEVGV